MYVCMYINTYIHTYLCTHQPDFLDTLIQRQLDGMKSKIPKYLRSIAPECVDMHVCVCYVSVCVCVYVYIYIYRVCT